MYLTKALTTLAILLAKVKLAHFTSQCATLFQYSAPFRISNLGATLSNQVVDISLAALIAFSKVDV